MIGTQLDITERKLSQLALEEAKLDLDLALEAAELGIWHWIAEDEEFRCSERSWSILGYRVNEFKPTLGPLKRLIHPDDALTAKLALDTHLASKSKVIEAELRLRHKDGHWVWVLIRGKVVSLDEQETSSMLAGTIRDISEQKQLKLEGGELLKRIEALILGFGTRSGLGDPPRELEPIHQLTKRQQEVLALIASGFTSARIAEQLKISRETAMGHRAAIMHKLDLHSAAELTRYAIQNKIVS